MNLMSGLGSVIALPLITVIGVLLWPLLKALGLPL